MKLSCPTCGKQVSTEVPDGTVIRAWWQCPECVAKQPDTGRLLDVLKEIRMTAYAQCCADEKATEARGYRPAAIFRLAELGLQEAQK